jgi:hypothetical protein
MSSCDCRSAVEQHPLELLQVNLLIFAGHFEKNSVPSV